MLISHKPSIVVVKYWLKKLDISGTKERDVALNQTSSFVDRKVHHTLGCFEDTSTWIKSLTCERHEGYGCSLRR